ncbi:MULTISPECIES: sugar transferase [unclassified Solwaraspora]|uniref:sugar transferase n=1 Tax=unclassified Solwaraspora TaxID=2627926 RepID=UPI00248BF2E8|nr:MULTISPECIES: sugar transferase [unclassified Solwaraspora]WBB97822.1 sugar transferase [Solwaraspora sp. WMMA2059]WJK34293.1 sugar transferase [Solwaraspora sp. WMMA2065]
MPSHADASAPASVLPGADRRVAPRMPNGGAGRRHSSSPDGSRGGRVLVLENDGPESPADRLDEEFDVALRLRGPVDLEALPAVLAQYQPKLLLLKQSLDAADARLIAACRAHRVPILVLARPVYGLLRPARLRRYGGLPWFQLRSGPLTTADRWAKRGLDLALILLAAPLLIPLLLLVGLAVAVTGPPLYVQTRVGAGGRLFRLVKFRTMHVDAESATGPTLAAADDERITRLGRLLRRTRLDELPQLWNVLRGEMSLVGPRPERPEFVGELCRLQHYHLRHLIRPGLTGIAQLTGGYAATAEDKLRCDLLYLHCRSLRLDLGLLLLTIVELCRGFPRG